MAARLLQTGASRVILPAITGLLLTTVVIAQPVITLSVSSGPPTTKLLVSGSGFDPYSAVDVYFDTKDLALAVTDGSGSFGQIGITVPGSAKPGGHWITGVERHTGLAGQTRFLVETNWFEFHFSPDLNGFNPFENVLNAVNVQRLGVRWTYTPASNSPVVANGIVYAASTNSQNHEIYALDARTGALLWSYTTGGRVYDSPAVSNGAVYFGADDGYIYALNARTGGLLWRRATLQYGVESSATVVNGIVYIGADDEFLRAIDGRTGTVLWSHWGPDYGPIRTSPAVANGVVYYSQGNFLWALDAKTGNTQWNYFATENSPINGSPAVANGVVYFGDQYIYALNANDGTVLWKYSKGNRELVESSPAVANGILYVGSDDNYVYALNASDGTLLWKYQTGDMVLSSPAVANGVVYVGSYDGKFYALSARTGELLWEYAILVPFSPAVANGVVYVGSSDSNANGSLYAFDLTGGDTEAASQPPEPHTLVPDLRLKEFDAGREK